MKVVYTYNVIIIIINLIIMKGRGYNSNLFDFSNFGFINYYILIWHKNSETNSKRVCRNTRKIYKIRSSRFSLGDTINTKALSSKCN